MDRANREWTRICDALITFTMHRNSMLPRGPWQQTCTAFVPKSWGKQARGLRREYAVHAAKEFNFSTLPGPGPVSWDGGDLEESITISFSGLPTDDAVQIDSGDPDDGSFGAVIVDVISFP